LILRFFIAFVNLANTSVAALQIKHESETKRSSIRCGYDHTMERTQEQCKQP
jgi:hypothetical protein